MTKLVRGLMYGKPARVDAYFAKTTRRNTDNFWHGGPGKGRTNDTIDNQNNGGLQTNILVFLLFYRYKSIIPIY